MPKSGPKPYSHGSGRTMPVSVIARRLGISVRTVNYDLSSGLRKMRSAAASNLAYLLMSETGSFGEVRATREVR